MINGVCCKNIPICYKPQLLHIYIYFTPLHWYQKCCKSQTVKRVIKEYSNLICVLRSKWRPGGMQLVRNLARLSVMTLKAMWWYACRWHTISIYTETFSSGSFIFQEMSFSVHSLKLISATAHRSMDSTILKCCWFHCISVFYTLHASVRSFLGSNDVIQGHVNRQLRGSPRGELYNTECNFILTCSFSLSRYS